jgi:hypothetical protein
MLPKCVSPSSYSTLPPSFMKIVQLWRLRKYWISVLEALIWHTTEPSQISTLKKIVKKKSLHKIIYILYFSHWSCFQRFRCRCCYVENENCLHLFFLYIKKRKVRKLSGKKKEWNFPYCVFFIHNIITWLASTFFFTAFFSSFLIIPRFTIVKYKEKRRKRVHSWRWRTHKNCWFLTLVFDRKIYKKYTTYKTYLTFLVVLKYK